MSRTLNPSIASQGKTLWALCWVAWRLQDLDGPYIDKKGEAEVLQDKKLRGGAVISLQYYGLCLKLSFQMGGNPGLGHKVVAQDY